MPLCEPPAHDGSSENALVNPSPPYRKAQGRPDPPLEGEGNSLSLRERVRPVLREVEGVRVGIFMPLCEPGLMTVQSKSLRSSTGPVSIFNSSILSS